MKQCLKFYLFSAIFVSVLISLPSFAEVFIETSEKMKKWIADGDKLTRQNAWDFYQKLFLEKDKEIESALIETTPGQYQDAQSLILKKMAEIADHHKDVTRLSEKQADAFLKTISSKTDVSDSEFIKKAHAHLYTKTGFEIFDRIGDGYAEKGNCTNAVSFWEKAKAFSLGYKKLNKEGHARFSAKLGYCYKRLGWKDKLKVLFFEESPELTKLEGEALVGEFERIQQLLKSLHDYSEECPDMVIEASSMEKMHMPPYLMEVEGGVRTLSTPLEIGNRVFILATDNGKDLYLFTLDKNTGKILKKQMVAYKYKGWLGGYKLFFEAGKVKIVTEESYHEFSADGQYLKAVNFNVEENREYFAQAFDGSISILTNALKDENLKVRIEAIHTLERIGSAKAVDLLIEVLKKDEDPDVRGRAARVLEVIGGAKAVGPLIEVLKKDESPEVRWTAARALGWIRDPKAVDSLINVLKKDEDFGVKQEAAAALVRIGDPKAVDSLINVMKKDENPFVRTRAADALKTMLDPESDDPLIQKINEALRERR